MRNRHIKKVLAMVCILSCMNISTSYASMVENYNFKNITIEDGLSQSTVETIYQDSKGYIWMGTNDVLIDIMDMNLNIINMIKTIKIQSLIIIL